MLSLPRLAQADQVELHLVQLAGDGLGLAQANDHPCILKGHAGLIDTNYTKAAVEQADRLAHLDFDLFCRRPPNQDLAVVRLSGRGSLPPPVAIGSSNDLQVGQAVFAIGNPFGLDQSLTTGIISVL